MFAFYRILGLVRGLIGSLALTLAFIDEGPNLLQKYHKTFFMSCYDNYMDFFFSFCVCSLVGACALDFLARDSQTTDLCVIDSTLLWSN